MKVRVRFFGKIQIQKRINALFRANPKIDHESIKSTLRVDYSIQIWIFLDSQSERFFGKEFERKYFWQAVCRKKKWYSTDAAHVWHSKALFTRREGNPGARVTLALTAGVALAKGLPYLPCKRSARDNLPTQVNFPPSCMTSNPVNLNGIIQFLSLITNIRAGLFEAGLR